MQLTRYLYFCVVCPVGLLYQGTAIDNQQTYWRKPQYASANLDGDCWLIAGIF
jgi:hypothetical protein